MVEGAAGALCGQGESGYLENGVNADIRALVEGLGPIGARTAMMPVENKRRSRWPIHGGRQTAS